MNINTLDPYLDSERSQAMVRCGVASVVLAVLAYLAFTSPGEQTNGVQALGVVAVFWVGSVGWAVWVWRSRQSAAYRRLSGLVLDIAGTTAAFMLADNLSAFFYPIYQWIIIGHGMRYGKNAMFMACALAVAGFSLVVAITPYWKDNMLVASGLLVGLIILPLYLVVLMKKLHDLNERLKAELSKTYHAASHDQLTGVANRQYFHKQLSELIREARRTSRGLAVLFIDLDEFKAINDRLGHTAGDKVLKIIAERLRHNCRDDDITARFGGDEFALIINNARSCEEIEGTVARLIDAICRPISVHEQAYQVTGSIGISIFPRDGQTPDELTHHADLAMYEAKRTGKNAYICFSNMTLTDADRQTKLAV